MLAGGEPAAVFLGNFATHHPQAALTENLAQRIAAVTGAHFGVLGEAANSVGGHLAGALPTGKGLDAAAMLRAKLGAYVLLGCEPELDTADGAAALAAMHAAEFVVALSPFQHRAVEYADVLLPMAPFTETAGTFVSTEGRVQSFKGVVQPLGEARPGWKILRVLGNLFDVDGFDHDNAEAVKTAALADVEVAARLDNSLTQLPPISIAPATTGGLERIGDVPIHFADPIVRRAPALQRTRDALAPQAWMNAATLASLGLSEGDQVRVTQGDGSVLLFAGIETRVPDGAVRISAGHVLTANLGPLTGAIRIERIAAAAKASA